MHTKIFQQNFTDGRKNTAQIRCYFAYNQSGTLKSKEEWVVFIQSIMGDYVEGVPSFVEMAPASLIGTGVKWQNH